MRGTTDGGYLRARGMAVYGVPIFRKDGELRMHGNDERIPVENLRAVVSLLRQQGKDLTAFWDSGQPEEGAKYEATRKEAWKQISVMLGLDKK